MSRDYGFDLLKDEKLDVLIRPHPLSFVKYYAASVYLLLLAIALNEIYQKYIKSNQALLDFLKSLTTIIPWVRVESILLLLILWAVLVLSGLIIGVLWVSKMPLIYVVLISVAGTILEIYFPEPPEILFLPKPLWILIISFIVGFLLVEAYRRGHRYFLTNYRIVTVKRFITREVREIMYDKIADIYIDQGLLGRIFNYGTIIPVSESGFGLGEDAALASLSAAAPIGKKGVMGVSVGGKRGVSRPRAATYFSLYGVPNPRRIRGIIGERQLEFKEAPILRRIEDLLREEKKGKEKEGGYEGEDEKGDL